MSILEPVKMSMANQRTINAAIVEDQRDIREG